MSLFADILSPSQIDVVLVVDVSKSMISSDPEKLSFEAIKMFIDMTTVSDNKVGIIAYSDKIEREKALLTINNYDDKKTLHNFITQLEFIGMYTDIPLGLKEAVKVLEDGRDVSHKPLIILLTDGRNDLTRGEEEAENDLEDALNSDFPIYTIGLNANGKVDGEYLGKISNDSNAKTFITDKAEDLPVILTQIFGDHTQTDPVDFEPFEATGDFQSINIPLTNENVIEANISILSSQPVESKLYDPDNIEMTIPSENIYFSQSTKYSLIKIIFPEKGDWVLDVKGVKKDQINVSIIFNYDIKIILKNLPKNSFDINDDIKIEAFLESASNRIEDMELYSSIESKIVLLNSKSEEINEYPMDNTSNSFIGTFNISESGNYEIFIKSVKTDTFFRESEKIEIIVKTPPPPDGPEDPPKGPEDPKEVGSGRNKFLIILLSSIGGLIILGIAIFFITRLIKKKNKSLVGQVVLIVKEKDGTESSPRFRHLNDYKGKVSIFELLSEKPEFAETNNIHLLPGKLDNIIIKNLSNVQLEQFGEIIDAKNGYELNKNDKITIFLQGSDKNITLEYKL